MGPSAGDGPVPGDALTARFFRAIKAGDRDGVRALLSADRSLVDAYDPNAYDGTPLNVAASRGDLAMIDLLLEHGADIDRKSAWWAGGFAPIHSIFWGHHERLGPELIARGAMVDAHAAAGLGMMDRLRDLLDEDPARVHERGGDGQLPLHFAATPAVAELLLGRGAEIDARDVDHVGTAAQWAARDRPAVTRYLLEQGAQADPFMLSAVGDLDRLRTVVREDPTVLEWTIDAERFPAPGSLASHIYCYTIGWQATPLHVAARCDRPEVAHLLVDLGADPAIRADYDACTPLHVAAWEGNPGVAEALIDRGAPIDVASGVQHENEPLGWAVVSGKPEVVRLLLERGAPVHPHHVRQAGEGARGAFLKWSASPLEAWAEIVRMLGEA